MTKKRSRERCEELEREIRDEWASLKEGLPGLDPEARARVMARLEEIERSMGARLRTETAMLRRKPE